MSIAAEIHEDSASGPVLDSNEDLNIEQRHSIWKKNTPCLYDMILTHSLDWPSLSVEFFRDVKEENDYNVHKLLLGTHTSETEQDYLMIGQVKLPNDTSKLEYNPSTGEYGGYDNLHSSIGRVDIQIKINHDKEVNKARVMPQNPNIIASQSPSSKVYIFDITSHPSVPIKSGETSEELVLKGHNKEGFSLSWNPHESGHLLSANNDGLVCLWDISAAPQKHDNKNHLAPKSVFSFHRESISEAQWHFKNPVVFGSVSDDKSIAIWDTRETKVPQLVKQNAHEKEINCIAFHPQNDYFFITGSSDNTIIFWDMRQASKAVSTFPSSSSPLKIAPEPKTAKVEENSSEPGEPKSKHSFDHHTSDVTTLEWCPHNETVFASGSSDYQVKIWNLAQIGAEQTAEDAEDGPPELIFVHGGHTDVVCDISWHYQDPMMIASVAEDNILHMWKMNSDILASTNEE